MALDPIIAPLDPDTFEYQTYSLSDEELIVQSDLDTVFSASTDYIEYYVYDQNKKLIYPGVTTPLNSYNVREGDVLLDPASNLEELGFDVGVYSISYSFYRKRGSSSITDKYFISEISSDRTEIRLDSNVINNEDIISSINDFVNYREEQSYFVDFYLNFGGNQIIIANNIKLETEEEVDPTVLIKLYEPLPANFGLKNELWLVELLSTPQAYEVDFPFEPIVEDDFTYIAGPNYNLDIIGQTSTPGEQFSYNTLLNSDITSSINQIQSLLNEKEININIDYENYSNFVNFSSAKTRLENFFYKVELIQSKNIELASLTHTVTSNTTNTFAYSESITNLSSQIDTIIKNFDGYEYFLYFNSGSDWSYPKSTLSPPYTLYPTSNTEVQSWITSSAASASAYDIENKDWLYYSIPEYLREDPANRNYELFVDMVGQYYDNVWTYTKDVTNKFDADNRLDYGISKDLVADAIKDFAVKLYSNNFNTDDLFTAFLGITPSGSAFPFPNMTGSLPTPTGYEYVNTEISASNDIVPLDDVNKRLYKRIYHNIPYLLKTKGTVAGIRALITSYGIPDTILRISEFGGKDRNESQDWDLKQDVFNYAFDTGENSTNFITSSVIPNNDFNYLNSNSPQTVQFRFKSHPIPLPTDNIASSDIRYSQSLWLGDTSTNSFNQIGAAVVLEYNGNGLISGSYSGSIPSPYDTWGRVKFYPNASLNSNQSIEVYAPFFNEDWWSVQVTFTGSSSTNSTASLFVANEINGEIGFSGSEVLMGLDSRDWNRIDFAALNIDSNKTINSKVYKPFSGSYQEYRMFTPRISESKFFDYTVNPYSAEGNTLNSTPNELFFRADLGTQLDTGSTTSIHPRVTGSAVQITQSFNGNTSEFYTSSANWVTNVEDIFQDQVPVGIKNRITDKIKSENLILAEAPYGFPNSTSSVPEISSRNNDTQTISAMESMQQNSFVSQSYTPNVNYLEVAFSPSNQINDDINAQLGYFNLGEFIGDPRFQSSSLYTYPDLDRLRNAYFEKYMDSYDVVDFVRLIKFFDNSLFKMIKDFTPARSSLASGVVVKQHILERNRQRPAQLTSSLHDYEGLVVNLPKDYNSGSTDFPQYSTSGSAIYKFSGGTGGSFEKFNGLQTYNYVRSTILPTTNLYTGIKENTLLGLSTDDYDAFPAIINHRIPTGQTISGSNSITAHSSSIVEIASMVGVAGPGGTLNITSLFVGNPNSNPEAWIGDELVILSSDVESGASGKVVVDIQPNFLTNITSEYPDNRFGVTQSWQDGNDGSILNPTNFNQSSSQFISGSYLGPREWVKDNQSEFYDGIFSGSNIVATTQSLNPGCEPYLNVVDTPLLYKPIFFTSTDALGSTVALGEFLNQNNVPPNGHAWILSQQTFESGQYAGVQQVVAIKLSQDDANGIEVINYLDDFSSLRVLFLDAVIPYNEAAVEYIVTGRTIYPDHALLNISQQFGIDGNNYPQTVDGVDYFPITSSTQGGSMNWSLTAQTDYNTLLVHNTQSSDLLQQNVLSSPNSFYQEQNIYYWSGQINDALGFFPEEGAPDVETNQILNAIGSEYDDASYNPPYTSNIPWLISASVVYSSSLDVNAALNTIDDGIYHSGSSYQGAGLTNQNFVLGNQLTIGSVGFAISAGFVSAAAAAAATDPTLSSNRVFFSPTSTLTYISQDLYADIDLTNSDFPTAYSLPVGSYIKLSNLDTDGTQYYFVGQIAAGSGPGLYKVIIQSRSLYSYPTSGKGPLLGNGFPAPTLFRPSPRYVTDLGTVNFNGNNWDTQIPGNSGSGTDMNDFAGHPKIKFPGTASFKWTFPSLTLAGTVPTLGPGTPTFSPLSGSQVSSNGNFAATFNPDGDWVSVPNVVAQFLNDTVGPDPDMGQNYDGSILIDMNIVSATIDADIGFNWTPSETSLISTLKLEGANTTDSFNLKCTLQKYNPTTGELESSPITVFNASSFNGVINMSNLGSINISTSQVSYNKYYRLLYEIKNNSTTDLEYTFEIDGIDLQTNGTNLGQPFIYEGTLFKGANTGNGYTNLFHGASNSQPQTHPATNADFYPQGVVDVYLKRTGSAGEFTITGSTFATGGGYSGSIYSGSVLPITNGATGFIIPENDTPATSDPTSTLNEIGDIYFVEYSASEFKNGQIGGLSVLGQTFSFETDSDLSRLEITQSSTNTGATPTFNTTGSVILRQANRSAIGGPVDSNGLLPIGNEVLKMDWNADPLANGTTRVNLTGSFTGDFIHDDIFRFSVASTKTGLGSGIFVNELTCSIFPSQSIWSPISAPFAYDNYRAPSNTGFIVPTYYPGSIPFELALDCHPTLNNYSLGRFNPYLQDVDYNNESGPIIPVNQDLILEDKAVRAQTPVSNYTQLSSINPKYDGSKSTSQEINVWSVGDEGTFGKNPTVELKDAFFGYFNDISDPYPNINALTKVNINYLIDEQGNALPPSLEDQLSIDTFEQVFPNNTEGKLAIKSGKTTFTPIQTPSPINRLMQDITPICYSQNSGNNYSNTIPLSGSGYISRYDNDDESTVIFGGFQAAGTSSVVDTVGVDVQEVNYYINPSEANESQQGSNSAYTGSGASDSTGSASYPTTPWGTAGDDLANAQVVSIQHSVVTSYVSETKGVRDELDLTFKMFTGSDEGSQSPFNLEGIDCKVYTDTGQVYLITDVDEYGWFTYKNLPTSRRIRKRKKGLSFKRFYYTRVPIPGGGIKCKVDWEMFETLFDLGLMRQRHPRNGAGVQALEWIFKANSGNHTIKVGEKISWKVEGFFKKAKSNCKQGLFFPNAYQGSYTPAMIQGVGAQDYLLSEANKAAAPFWVFTGSAGGQSNIIDQSILVMSSSNFNEAYGTGFYQGDLPYEPGFSEYFPSNVEPKSTAFAPIENVLELRERDEIRFGNNESYTYTILEVFAPSENVESTPGYGKKARLKIRLDRPVDTSVNKDFFLVRRSVPNPQSLYLDMNFPYGTLSSGSIFQGLKSTKGFAITSTNVTGSFPVPGEGDLYTASISNVEALSTPGILYPDFPTEYLIQSASIIVNDLISKGVIES